LLKNTVVTRFTWQAEEKRQEGSRI